MAVEQIGCTTDDPIVRLAKQTDTALHSWTPTTVLIDSQGRIVEESLANKALDGVWQTLEKAAEHSQKYHHQIDAQQSLYDFFSSQHLKDPNGSHSSEYQRGLILGISEMWGAYVGAPVDRQSLKFFFLEDCVDEDDRFVAGGYEKIVARAAETVLRDADIKFGKQVVRIRSNQNSVLVKCLEGFEQEFSDVVVTCPLGWLKRNLERISPMACRLAAAIKSVSVGNLEKIFLFFPKSFWDEGRAEPLSFFHWNTPQPSLQKELYHWKLEAVSLAAMPAPHCQPGLLFYTFGDCASHLVSLVHGKHGEERFGIIKNFLRPYYSRLPYFDSSTCEPVAALATEWSQDEFAGFGSYCNFQVGMTEADEDVKAMRHGMPEHHIWFAGEHTAPFDALGTVSGAYISGEKVAERIVNAQRDRRLSS